MRDIPLYNRSIFGLAFLAGGVTETTGSGVNDNYPSGTNFVSNGQRNATAQISLDDVQDVYANYSVPDEIMEKLG